MKINRIIGIVAVLIAAVSCQVVPEEDFSGLNRTGEKGVFCYFPTLVYDEPDTKAVTAADDNIHVTFDDGDRIGIWSDEGTLLTYKLKVIHENEASASFSGGGFTLENGEDYTSIYPRLMTDEFEAIPLSFEGQVQKDNADPGHLKNYLYMWAQATCIDYATAFHYNYLPGFIRFRLTFAEAATVKTVKLVADTKVFDPEPTLNAATGVLTKGTLSKEISVDLKNGFHVEADGTIVVYMAAAPFASATVTVQAVTTDDKVFFSTETRTISALESGHIKKLTRTMQFIDTEHNIEIDSSTETEKDLEVEGDLHVTIVKSDSNTVNSMTINATNEAKHPDNVYITVAEECTLDDMDLTINMPYSHVVLSAEADEQIGSITTNTSLNTLVLTDMITVKAVTIAENGGGLTVDGKITGTLTVPNNAAVDQTEPEKIWVKINESAEVGTISVVETNCNLYIAGTVGTVTTSAAQTTVEGTVTQNLTADGTAEVMVTSSAVVEDATLVAKSESIIYLDADAQIPESDSSYYGDQEEGEFTGTIRPNAKPVASVDGVDYMSLESAIAAVPTTGIKTTITLLKDLTAEDITANVFFGGSFAANSTTFTPVTSKNVTLNLNGHNITSAKTLYLAGGTLEITGTGTIETTGSGVAAVGVLYAKANAADGVDLTSKRTLTIGENVTLKGAYGLNVFGTNEETIANSIEVNMNGYIDGSNLFIIGNLRNASNVVNVNVNGTIVAPIEGDKAGVALNGNANVVIGANASISAPTGIEVRAGNLTVNGGTIRGTKAPTDVTPNGSGTTTVGAGIAVAQHTTKLPIDVVVSGGIIEGHTGLYIVNPQNNTAEYMRQVNVSVTGGTFNAINEGTNSVAKGADTDSATLSITGGTFNSDPTDYLAAGYFAADNGNGTWTVDGPYVARIGAIGYTTLQAAVDAAQSGATIDIITDFTLTTVATEVEGRPNDPEKFNVNVNKSVTINGNNHTITGSQGKRPLAISGTGNTITINDLTVTGTGEYAQMFITSVLTCNLNHVTIDGTNHTGAYNQPLTISTGREEHTIVNINNSVIMTDAEGNDYYAIIVWSPADIAITNSTIKGWANVYLKPGADGSNVSIAGSTMQSKGHSGGSNEFGLIAVECANNTITLDNNTAAISEADGETFNTLLSLSDYYAQQGSTTCTGNTIYVKGGTTFTGDGTKYTGIASDSAFGEFDSTHNNKLYFDDSTVESFRALASYNENAFIGTSKEDNGYYLLRYIPDVYYYWDNGDNTYTGYYVSLAAPFTAGSGFALCPGEFITLQRDITLHADIECNTTESLPAGSSFTMTFGDYTITKGDYSIKLATGVSVVTDKQTDIFTAASEGALIVETASGNTYTYTATGPVAQIGETKYATLEAAMAAANAMDGTPTITILSDCSMDATSTLTKSMSWDLSGHTITNNVGGDWMIKLDGAITLTIDGNDGSFIIPDTNLNAKGFIALSNDGEKPSKVFIEDATLTGKVKEGAFIQFRSENASQEVSLTNVDATIDCISTYANIVSSDWQGGNEAKVTVNGGTYVSSVTNSTTRNYVFHIQNCTVDFEDVTINSVMNAPIASSRGTVTNCNFRYPTGNTQSWQDAALGLCWGAHQDLTIDGGTYEGEFAVNIWSSGADVVINDGTFRGNKSVFYVWGADYGPSSPWYSYAGTYKITINGGIFEGTGNNPMVIQTVANSLTLFTIKGGTFTGAFAPASASHISITGGTFDHDPSAYVAAGYEATYDSTTQKWTVAQMQGVAKIGNTPYATLAAALAAATSGQTVTLLSNVETTAQFEVDKEMTLDLNGKTIQYTGTSTLASGVIMVLRGANLTITDSGSNGSILGGEMAYAAVALTKDGETSTADAQLTVNGGTLRGHYYAIVGNGNRQGTVITVNGGTLVGVEGSAIYHPQAGTLTITGGSLRGADTGVELRSGTLNISGGTFTATAAEYSCSPNGNGSTTTGAALAIAQHTTNQAITANITGGIFEGTKKLSISNPQNNAFNNVTVSGLNTLFGDSVVVPDGYIWSNNGDGTSSLFKPVTTWDGSSKEALTVVDADTYAIYSAAQLAQFAYNVNNGTNYAGKTVVLMNDIDLNNQAWTPIGNTVANWNVAGTGFAGTFDGNEKTVSNLAVSELNGGSSFAGFFGIVNPSKGNTVTIKDLAINNFTVASNHQAGAIVGHSGVDGGVGKIVITGCSVSNGTLTSTPTQLTNGYDDANQVGAIAGALYNGAHEVTSNNVSTVTINGFRDLGGLVGFMTAGTMSGNTVTGATINQVDAGYTVAEWKKTQTVNEFVGRRSNSESTCNTAWELGEGNTFAGTINRLVSGVARIGDTYYTTLADAVAAAQSGATIELIADDDISLTSGGEIEINKPLTITGATDSKGEPKYTVFGTSNQTGYNDIFITGGGSVTLSNLKIKNFGNNASTNPEHAPVYVSTNFQGTVNLNNVYVSDFNRGGIFLYGGTFNVDDCFIDCANSRSGAFTKGIEIKGNAHGTISDTFICNMECSSTASQVAGIEILGNGSITVERCTIVSDNGEHSATKGTYGIVSSRVGDHNPSGGSTLVNECLFECTQACLSIADSDQYGSVNNYSFTVTDCDFNEYVATWSATSSITIESGSFAEQVYAGPGTITIHGGEFGNFLPETEEGGSIVITGGTFDADPSVYVAEGYAATYDSNSEMWTVAVQPGYIDQAIGGGQGGEGDPFLDD